MLLFQSVQNFKILSYCITYCLSQLQVHHLAFSEVACKHFSDSHASWLSLKEAQEKDGRQEKGRMDNFSAHKPHKLLKATKNNQDFRLYILLRHWAPAILCPPQRCLCLITAPPRGLSTSCRALPLFPSTSYDEHTYKLCSGNTIFPLLAPQLWCGSCFPQLLIHGLF